MDDALRTREQRRALDVVSRRARRAPGAPLDPRLRLTLNFHPDRPGRDGSWMLTALAGDGVYHSQFVTGTGNGGLTAYRGGERWRWERRLFDGAYDEVAPELHPVYGALNLDGAAYGGAPRFGSCCLRLTRAALARATFCFPDSSRATAALGVVAHDATVAAATRAVVTDPLDVHPEAQVHGPVRLERDVEAVVLDPSFREMEVAEIAAGLPCRVEWHGGFRLTVAELRRHEEYRGPEYVALGAALAVDGVLTPKLLGDAVRTGRYDPQAVKKVWHHLACFGAPAAEHNSRPRDGR